MNYKLTAVSFKTWEEATEFVSDNFESWVWVDVNGVKTCQETFPVYNQEIIIGYTVVFAKKIRKPVKEKTILDCVELIKNLGRNWIPRRNEGVITLQHDKTGKHFKGIKAQSWRGLLRIINRLNHEWSCADTFSKEREWLEKYELV